MLSRTRRHLALGSALIAAALAVSACGGSTGTTDTTSSAAAEAPVSSGGASPAADVVAFNLTPDQNRITTSKNDAAAALVPAKVRDRGTLVVGGGFGSGSVPLGFYADDNKTPIGLEVDIAYLVAQALGLKPEIEVRGYVAKWLWDQKP